MFTNIKEDVLGRIEQSFELLFSNMQNFWKLVLPIFLYKMLIGIVIWNFISFWLLGSLDVVNTDIFSSPYYVSIFFFVIVWFILYITFFIWVLLATIKWIKDILEWKKINVEENLKYWFDNLIKSFNTYWYIFAYITLWPFLFIAIWWILIILSYIFWIDSFSDFWMYIMWFWFLFLLFFMIFRGVKTNFSIISAVDKNSFTKENFLFSVKITDNNWWRIVWNFVLVSLIISIISSILWSILSIFSTSVFDIIDFGWLVSDYSTNSITQDSVTEITDNIKNFYNTFYLNNFIVSIFESFLNNIVTVFMLIFTFLFYKRLEIEYKWIDKQKIIIENKNINTEKKEIEL